MNRWVGIVAVLCMTSVAHAAEKPVAPFKHDNKTPIDISADALEVLQDQNKAIFTGKVVAVQGDVRMTSEKMTVFYRPQEEKKEGKPAASESNAIRRIEVEKNVFLTTPTETASGAGGTYDVQKNNITLTGNVVLTRDKNTLKGERLVYDFATGKSTLTAGDNGAKAGEKGKTRVRALFIPENNDTIKPETTPKP